MLCDSHDTAGSNSIIAMLGETRRKLASVRSMTDQQLQEGSVCTEAPEDVVHSAT